MNFLTQFGSQILQLCIMYIYRCTIYRCTMYVHGFKNFENFQVCFSWSCFHDSGDYVVCTEYIPFICDIVGSTCYLHFPTWCSQLNWLTTYAVTYIIIFSDTIFSIVDYQLTCPLTAIGLWVSVRDPKISSIMRRREYIPFAQNVTDAALLPQFILVTVV